jgi:two-component system cell cycle sensor histidine kinase/response regulator CckA
MRVLVVEDEPLVRHLIDRAVTGHGHHALLASTVFDAMALLLDFPEAPDIALLDMVLPGMGGLAYASLLEQQFPGIRLVFMTGWLDHTQLADAEKRGTLLPKPFTLHRLFTALGLPPETARSAP